MIVCTRLDTFCFSAFGVVVVGRRLNQLTERERFAVVHHEKGHIALHHSLKRMWWALTLRWLFSVQWLSQQCRKQELEADLWAAKHGFGPDLLSFLSRLNAPESIWHPSTEQRCQALREYINGSKQRV